MGGAPRERGRWSESIRGGGRERGGWESMRKGVGKGKKGREMSGQERGEVR